MKDNFDYLSLYPKEFLVAFGYQTKANEDKAERAARRAATRMMQAGELTFEGESEAPALKRTHCKYKHPASQFGFINCEGYQRCRECLRATNRRYEARKCSKASR